MSWRLSLKPIWGVLLRVPPLFMMDAILNEMNENVKHPFGFPQWQKNDGSSLMITSLFWIFFLVFFVQLLSSSVFTPYPVPKGHIFILFNCWNHSFVEDELSAPEYSDDPITILKHSWKSVLTNLGVQLSLGYMYNLFLLDSSYNTLGVFSVPTLTGTKIITYLVLLQTMIFRFMAIPAKYLQFIPTVSVAILSTELILILISNVNRLVELFRTGVMGMKYKVRAYGLQTFLESQWSRLNVPNVLRTFWLIRTLIISTYFIFHFYIENISYIHNVDSANHTDDNYTVDYIESFDKNSSLIIHENGNITVTQDVIISGCETVIALLGMTSIVAYITHYIGLLVATFIGSDNEEDRNMGTMSAILFFILALQTGLTALDPGERLHRLYRNLCLLSTAILHFVHGMISPLLMNLSAAGNTNLDKHVRPLVVCFLLAFFPSMFLIYLWYYHSLSTWLLAVTAFSVEVIIKVIITLLVYSLFMFDAHWGGFWEELDDYVYYIKSTGNTIEFLFGIFLFCNGAFIMVFEAGGTIRAIMMGIHAYFNIWVQAKEGWKVFMKRRTAVNKINTLPMATPAQLHEHNDVCAICYQELTSARVTRCQHLFHGVCLRKWLYVQDKCPLCHKLMHGNNENADDSNGNANAGDAEVNRDNVNENNVIPNGL